MYKKQIGFWRCPHCQKAYPSQVQAEMCFNLDMKEIVATDKHEPIVKRNGSEPVKRNGNHHG